MCINVLSLELVHGFPLLPLLPLLRKMIPFFSNMSTNALNTSKLHFPTVTLCLRPSCTTSSNLIYINFSPSVLRNDRTDSPQRRSPHRSEACAGMGVGAWRPSPIRVRRAALRDGAVPFAAAESRPLRAPPSTRPRRTSGTARGDRASARGCFGGARMQSLRTILILEERIVVQRVVVIDRDQHRISAFARPSHTYSVHCSSSRFTYAATSYDYTPQPLPSLRLARCSRRTEPTGPPSDRSQRPNRSPTSHSHRSSTAPNCDFAQNRDRSKLPFTRTFFSRCPLVMCSYP